MEQDDEAPLSISKWPFYCGDILLVAVALAIGILSNWQLTDVQVACCVVAVGLGAVLFALPFVVEYVMRVREVADDRSSELRLLQAHFKKLEDALLHLNERLIGVEGSDGESEAKDPRVDLLSTAMELQFAEAAKRVVDLAEQVTELKAAQPDVAALLELIKAEQSSAFERAKAEQTSIFEKDQAEQTAALGNLKGEQAKLIEHVKAEQLTALERVKAEHLAAMERAKAEQVAAVEVLKSEQEEAIAGLLVPLDALREQLSEPSLSDSLLDTIQSDIVSLTERIDWVTEPLASLDERLKNVEGVAPGAEEVMEEVVEPRPVRTPRKSLKSDSGLLHRAIKEQQDSSSAVSRIIDAKVKADAVSPVAEVDEAATDPKAEVVDPPVSELEAVEVASDTVIVESEVSEGIEPEPGLEVAVEEDAAVANESVDAEAVTAETEPEPVVEADSTSEPELVVELDPIDQPMGADEIPADFEVSMGADLIEDEELLAAELAAAEAEAASEMDTELSINVEALPDISMDAKVGGADGDLVSVDTAPDFFGESDRPAVRRARTKKNDGVLTVSILIGIGNKPFLRGSGGGLNWESGVEMDFEEIGKWRWVAPSDLEEAVEVQVYRNDEDADRKGCYTIEPGQKLEVSPVF